MIFIVFNFRNRLQRAGLVEVPRLPERRSVFCFSLSCVKSFFFIFPQKYFAVQTIPAKFASQKKINTIKKRTENG
jgi:hypothetical protein